MTSCSVFSRKTETGFRYVFHHPGDKNRELTLTVLVFDVPEASSKT